MTVKQGRIDLQKEIVYLTDVYAGSASSGAQPKTLTWYVPTKLVEAQAMYFIVKLNTSKFHGSKAVGKLQTKVLLLAVVVVTEIIPNKVKKRKLSQVLLWFPT